MHLVPFFARGRVRFRRRWLLGDFARGRAVSVEPVAVIVLHLIVDQVQGLDISVIEAELPQRDSKARDGALGFAALDTHVWRVVLKLAQKRDSTHVGANLTNAVKLRPSERDCGLHRVLHTCRMRPSATASTMAQNTVIAVFIPLAP